MGPKNEEQQLPPLYNAYEAKLLNVLYSKLVKKKKSFLLDEGSSHPRTSPFKRKMISLSWVTCPFWRKLVYFHWRPSHTHSTWSIFTGDLLTHTHTCLFSRATCPHTLTLVSFQGRLAHTRLPWSIFTGDQPTHTYPGLFSQATCPHILSLVYFYGRPHMHTNPSLFSRATSSRVLTLVYFHRRPAHFKFFWKTPWFF